MDILKLMAGGLGVWIFLIWPKCLNFPEASSEEVRLGGGCVVKTSWLACPEQTANLTRG